MTGHVGFWTRRKRNVEVRLTMLLCDLHASSKMLWTFSHQHYASRNPDYGVSTTEHNVDVVSTMLLYGLHSRMMP